MLSAQLTQRELRLDLSDKSGSPITPASNSQSEQQLCKTPCPPWRITYCRDTANLDSADAGLKVNSSAVSSADAVSATGQIDSVCYGSVLKVGETVELRGAGQKYNGKYKIRNVTHNIKRGEYKQSFTLKKEGWALWTKR